MEEIRVPRLVSDAAYLRIATPPHCGTEVLRLEGVGHTYDGQRWVLRGVDLNIMRGDKIALVGFNGMGKTTLLRILAGVVTPTEGKRVLGHLVVPGYRSQDFAETMAPDESVYRVVKQANPEVPERQLRTLLGGFGFEGDAIQKQVDVLSGGEKIRLRSRACSCAHPNLLLLDEPTTHLNIQGRQTLEQTLRDYAGTVLLVSHDVTFVRNVATNIIALQSPDLQRYVGGYDYYRERVGSMPAAAPTRAPAASPAEAPAAGPIRARNGAACGPTSGASTTEDARPEEGNRGPQGHPRGRGGTHTGAGRSGIRQDDQLLHRQPAPHRSAGEHRHPHRPLGGSLHPVAAGGTERLAGDKDEE